MKKSLVALAVLAASGAAFAQSNVTVYGLADIWVGSVKADNGFTSSRETVMQSGGINTSRWGLKGSEDLGGGLKAVFKFEQGFKLDTGAGDTAGQAFSRQSYVGLAGGFGEVTFGKVWSAYDDVSGASDAMFDSPALAPMNSVFRSVNYQDRISNAIRYTTPEMGGFSGALSYGLDENAAQGLTSTSVSLSYGAGPLALQVGYQSDDLNGTTDAAEFFRVGGSYDFGMAALKATYGKVDNLGGATNANAEEYQIGVDIPVGNAIVVSASYAESNGSGGLDGFDNDGFGIAATYTLSKRTFLYTGYTNNTLGQGKNLPDASVEAFAVGVQHKF